MADEDPTPKWGLNWLLSPTGMTQLAQIIVLLIALIKAFQNGDKVDEAKVAADHAKTAAAATSTRVEDVQKDVQEVHTDVEQVKKVQKQVLMNQIRPKGE